LIRRNLSISDEDDAVRVLRNIMLVRHQNDRIALPVRFSNKDMISSPVFESKFPVGSSARTIDGEFTSARAMATRCRCPPESSFGL